MGGDDLARAERGLVEALEELVRVVLALVGGDRGPEPEHRRRVVGRRVVVGNRTSQGAARANLRITNQTRQLGQRRQRPREFNLRGHLVMPHGSPHPNLVGLDTDVLQIRQARHVDQLAHGQQSMLE